MTRTQHAFTDPTKAAVFVRDRATCAFSGKSLWLLDYGATPFWDVDWPDHIRPRSKGGSSQADNGVCASIFFNAKKRDNARDNQHLFRNGKPTDHFFYFHGVLPAETAKQLRRLSRLVVSDWYFNRALYSLLLGVQWVVLEEDGEPTGYDRDASYWCRAAYRKIEKWRALSGKAADESMERRGILLRSRSDDVKRMLTLRQAETPDHVLKIAHQLAPAYRHNWNLVHNFCEGLDDPKARESVVRRGLGSKKTHPLVAKFLKSNHGRID